MSGPVLARSSGRASEPLMPSARTRHRWLVGHRARDRADARATRATSSRSPRGRAEKVEAAGGRARRDRDRGRRVEAGGLRARSSREHVERYGGLDVLVNSAGIGIAGRVEDAQLKHVDLQLGDQPPRPRARHAAAIPHLRESKGSSSTSPRSPGRSRCRSSPSTARRRPP